MQEATEAVAIGNDAEKDANDVYTEKDAEDDLNMLKRTVINNVSTMNDIKDKLNATRKYRLQLMREHETDIREQFSCFFSHPNLVIFTCKNIK